MRKFAVPGTVVPGATRRMDEDGKTQLKDKRGRPLWDMPSPVSYAAHRRRVKDQKTGAVTEEKVMVPIYRGISAQQARSERATQRKMIHQAKAAEQARAMQGANDLLRDITMDPGLSDFTEQETSDDKAI